MSESEGTEVTFVNGHAESQTTSGESAIPTDERDAAVAAVKAALKREGETAAREADEADKNEPLRPRDSVERDADGKFKSVGKETHEKKPEDDDAASLKRVLQERKQIAQQKSVHQQEYQKQVAQLQNYQRQLQDQARQLEQERQRFAMLRKDPVRAIRENGWDPEAFILDIAQDGTPEGQAARAAREHREQLEELRSWRDEQLKQQQENIERQKHSAKVQHRQSVEQQFMGLVSDDGKHPHLATLVSSNEYALAGLMEEGDRVADKYRAMTGKEASLDDIAEYLEERRAEWYKTMSTRSQQAKAPVTSKGRPTQGSATGRTLSPDDSSERRSLGVNLKDLDGDERLAAAREAVGAAFRASGERR